MFELFNSKICGILDMIVDFFNTAANLKTVPRQGWKDRLGMRNPESVADHSYMTGLMAMVLSDGLGLDTLKIVKMSLLHDLAESKTGDLTPARISKREKDGLENAAMAEILQSLPEAVKNDYQGIWDDFQRGASEEAIFVHDVDKLEMALQARIYSKDAPEGEISVFLEYARASIRNKRLQDTLKEIISER